MAVTYHIISTAPVFYGWRHFWSKSVRGFDPTVHCARCLIGDWQSTISLRCPVNRDVVMGDYPEGEHQFDPTLRICH